jgi:hypothetical protein
MEEVLVFGISVGIVVVIVIFCVTLSRCQETENNEQYSKLREKIIHFGISSSEERKEIWKELRQNDELIEKYYGFGPYNIFLFCAIDEWMYLFPRALSLGHYQWCYSTRESLFDDSLNLSLTHTFTVEDIHLLWAMFHATGSDKYKHAVRDIADSDKHEFNVVKEARKTLYRYNKNT